MIEAVGDFDAAFFGMSPREAAETDPQQRLMLELGWEALEDAGIVPGSLRGEAVGVFVGAMNDDYATLLHRAGAPIGAHTATGLQRAMLANRLSYVLGTRGPSLAVDTAQSSSLVAVALAVESLRAGTSRIAVAGGVNLILADEGSAAMERLGALSPDGRCHTFDARANGYVRGEGGAAVVLKPLADALADGDPVYCVVRGVAIGNDGGGPGLTAPDREGQEAVLRSACAQAGVDPAEVHFVELHGTGTPVGDPVEAHALGAVHGSGRSADTPLLVGSVKTNIGHLEGAAGIAGLVKAVLCLRERTLPGSLNFDTPNPAIPLDRLRLKVQTAPTELHPGPSGAPLLAGVSSFGIGGTNCHVVLEHLPQPAPAGPDAIPSSASEAAAPHPAPPLLLSARSRAALRAQAARLHDHLGRTGADPRDIAYSLATTRTLFEHRAALRCGDREELAASLDAFARGKTSAGVRTGTAVSGGTAVLFTGQGAQWVGMGRELYGAGGVFAGVLDEVLGVVGEVGGRSLREVMFAEAGSVGAGLLGCTEFAQPALFALEVALFRALEARGVGVSVVLGHSVGEVAAAYVAGVFSLADAVRLVVARGRLMGALPVGGAMVSVGASEAELAGLVAGLGGRVSVAAVNGPASVVLSGEAGVLDGVVAGLVGRGVECRWLEVSHAFHSVLMDPMLEEFRRVAASVEFHRPRSGVAVVSSVTGAVAGLDELGDPEYWVRHVREAVRFADGVGAARDVGVDTFVEVGPHAVLTVMAGQCLDGDEGDLAFVPVLRRDRPELETFTTALATLYTRDAELDVAALHSGFGGRRVDLPTYPFQRRTHWSPALSRGIAADAGPGLTTTDAAGNTAPPESTEAPLRDPDDEPLTASPEPMSPEQLVRLVRETTATVLGHDDPDEIALDRTFTSQGLESATAVELHDLLNRATGLTLAATLVYDLPTPRAVAEHLVAALHGTKSAHPGEHEAVGAAAARGGTRDDDPIAIVGVGCRLPGGVDSRAALWDLLASGTDAISSFPADRGWDLDGLYDAEPGVPGKTYVRQGGFLHQAAEFDAEFFGISPREATAMDPQQRLLLETSWEALEDAGVLPESLRGGDTGVFIGAVAPEYGPRLHEGADGYEGYLLTGTTASVASGRIAYTLGTRGPALTVDTACSSSLVALHLAVQALRRGECGLALAGGATVMSGPGMFVEFSRQRGLAPDGRCMPFSADADGTAWSEGVAVLALERLSDARRAGHRVLAVVRGSAVNQDGASNGLTAPNGSAQEGVIRAALADAGLAPGDVDAVEAHGTGTALGDPIEAGALLATYGRERVGEPLWLGSLKSNVGHTQAAAGAAGVIKMLLAMRHGTLPRTLHADRPSTHVDWSSGTVELLAEARRWPERAGRPRRAAVSSFGISGTNAHLVIEEAPAETPTEPPTVTAPTAELAPTLAWPVSARSEEALRAQAARLREHVERVGADPVDVAHSLAVTRESFGERAVVVGGDRAELMAGLDALAAGHTRPKTVRGTAVSGGTAVLFTGQGAQWVGMGRELYGAGGVFAGVLDEVLGVVGEVGGRSLREVMFAEAGSVDAGLLGCTEFAQPALFALEVALFRALEARGVGVSVVLGHSVGEVAAAYVAGVFSLADAVRLVVARGRLMGALPVGGAMVSVGASEAELAGLVAGLGGRVSVAAVNGPASVVLSGEAGVLDGVVAGLVGRGVECRWLEVSHAFHSVLMDPMLEEFRRVAASVEFHRPRSGVAVVSSVTGAVAGLDELGDPEYWVRHVREAVRFADGVGAARDVGVDTFVEVGPHAVLTVMAGQCLDGDEGDLAFVPVLRRDRPELETFTTALATLYARGAQIDWDAPNRKRDARRIDLPTYPFQRARFWLDPAPAAVPTAMAAGSSEDVPTAAQGVTSATAGLRYRVTWQPAAVGCGVPRPAGRMLLLASDDDTTDSGLATAIARELAVRGTEVHTAVVPVGTGREAAADLLRAAGDGAARSTHVLWLAPAEPDTADAVALIQALGEAGPDAPLWITTRDAVAAQPGEAPSVAGAQLWGLGQVAALELAQRWGGLADLPGEPSPAALRAFVGTLLAEGEDNQFAVRPSGVHVRRVVPVPVRAATTAAARDAQGDTPDGVVPGNRRSSGTVLITGGTGALGAQVARRLARAGAPHLLLVGRRGAAGPGAGELVEELTALGTEVTVAACDVADRDALAALLAGIPEDRPLAAVLHAAGVLDDGVLDSLTSDRIDAVLRAKVTAARHLDELTADLPLDAFVLFSSIVGVWGNGGQAAYAAANAALDALAHRRRARGGRATSIAWGPWAGAGMASGTATKSFERDGVAALDPEHALDVLDDAVGAGGTSAAAGASAAVATSLIVADVDWETFVGRSVTRRTWALFDGVPAARSARSARAAQGRATLPRGTRPGHGGPGGSGAGADEGRPWLSVGPSSTERRRALLDLVCSEAAEILRHASADAVDPEIAFRSAGFDSLTVLELRNRLTAATGLNLPSTLLFDHPNPTSLAAHLHDELFGTDSEAEPVADTRARATADEREPIAIVGMACRYPGGVSSPEDLWRLVAEDGHTLSPFPVDRGWDVEGLYDPDPEAVGRSYVREGGFLHGAAEFDAEFFGISPREAAAMDPQQRLLLETSWEALERAGIVPDALRGTRTGVFTGISQQDYASQLGDAAETYGGHVLTGTLGSVISGRVAYVLGLEGPALTVDTACSSSLVALHLAVQSLRRGECDMALAGGVTVMATPTVFVEFSRQRGLASDGRCKAFAEGADGTVWAEGVGVLLVERLSDARRYGHRVLAVVRGSAVNQDGASNGLTAPSGAAQRRVIREALADAGLAPGDVDAVEAHGTGTALGDPIEAGALLATYGRERVGDPLWLGSLKSNIGHAQAAAGVGGVIKMVEAMRHSSLPRTLHVDAPSSRVEWGSGAVELLTEARSWPRRAGRVRRAAVSAFGVSGTNAHVVIEEPSVEESAEAEAVVTAAAESSSVLAWPVSARSEEALRGQAVRLREHVERVGADPVDVAHSLVVSRASFGERAVVVGRERGELLAGLDAVAAGVVAAGGAASGVVRGSAVRGRRVGVLFTGQGAQWVGMGRELYGAGGVFAGVLDEVLGVVGEVGGRSLREVMFAEAGSVDAGLLGCTEFAQPALFALEVALFRALEARGVGVSVVLGHSVGEVAAAYVAGVFSLADAVRLVVARGRLMGALPVGGAMVSVGASEAELAGLVAGLGGRVSVAAVNGPASVVLSGEAGVLDGVVAGLVGRGVECRWLEVSHAFHSVLMDPMLEEFRRVAASVEFHRPRSGVAVVSSVTGAVAGLDELGDPEYWVRHVREAVRFADGVGAARDVGVDTFVEVGPHAVLTVMAGQCLDGDEGDLAFVPVLRRDRPELETFTTALATLYARGLPVPPAPSEPAGRRVDLPTYAFHRDRYWLAALPRLTTGGVSAAGLHGVEHPLLAAAVELPGAETEVWTGRISAADLPWLADHLVWDRGVVPGSALLEMLLQVGSRIGLPRVAELAFETALTWAADNPVQIRVVVAAPASGPGGAREVSLHSRPEPVADPSHSTRSPHLAAQDRDNGWTRHASGLLAPAADHADHTHEAGHPHGAPHPHESGHPHGADRTGADAFAELTGAWPPAGAEPLDIAGQYPLFAAAGVRYEGAFRGLRAAWRRGDEIFAEVRLPDAHAADAARYGVHPALLDAALHPIALLDPLGDGGHGLLPFSWTDVRRHDAAGHALRVRVAAVDGGAVSIAAVDREGSPVLSARSLALRRIPADRLPAAPAAPLYRVDWVPLPGRVSVAAVTRWAVVGPEAEATAAGLRAVGIDARTHVLPFDEPLPPQVGADAEVILLDLTTATATATATASRTAPHGRLLGLLDELRATVRRTLEAVQARLADTDTDTDTNADAGADSGVRTDARTATRPGGRPRLVVLTRGAAGPEGGAADPAGAAVWGLVRVAQAEQPGRFTLVDVDGAQASLRALPGLLATDTAQLAVRDGRAAVPRLVRVADVADVADLDTGSDTAADETGAGEPAETLDPNGTVLITGGTGALAAETARHLVERHKARHLLLVSRRGPDAPGAAELAAELTNLGAEVTVRACDVADRDALRRLLGELPAEHPLTCVVHTAGVLDDGVLSVQTAERIDAVLRPKADAAVHLDELTRELGPVPLVLYSSVSAALGSAGQAGYAAANAFLDALAARRRAAGHPALSLGWGWWSGLGLATGLERADAARIRRSGVAPLDPRAALELFDRALVRPEPALLPVRLDLRAAARATVLPEVLRDLVGVPADGGSAPGAVAGAGGEAGTGHRPPAPADAAAALATRLAGRSAPERTALLLDLVRTEVAAVLGHGDTAAVGAARSFKDAGFDSLTAVDLRNRLNARTGLRLPATLVFDHPTPLSLAELLLGELTAAGRAEPAGPVPDEPAGAEDLSSAFDRLERSLAATDDGDARVRAAQRLRGLLAALTVGSGEQSGPGAGESPHGPGDVVIDRLRSASDDDLFDLLDSDFQ